MTEIERQILMNQIAIMEYLSITLRDKAVTSFMSVGMKASKELSRRIAMTQIMLQTEGVLEET